MSGETETNVSGWTVDTLKAYFDERLDAHKVADMAAHQAEASALAAAFAAAKEAVVKSEHAAEKRFDSVNEFRGQLADQAAGFLPRREYDVQHDALAARVANNERAVLSLIERSVVKKEGFGYVVGSVGMFTAIAALILAVVLR